MCRTLIQDIIMWLRENPGGRAVDFCLTSNEVTVYPNGDNLVSYVKGSLTDYSSGQSVWGGSGAPNSIGTDHYTWERITGTGVQAFNDRNQFDGSQTDNVELSVGLSIPGPSPMPFHLSIDLRLVTWGGGVIPLTDFHCQEGVLSAYADGSPDRNGPNKVGYTITFKKVSVPG